MGGICKLIIKAYADDSFSSEKGEFKSSVNPSNLRITNNVNYSSSQMMGGKSAGLRYNTSDPQELSFSLIFDNSGVFVDNKLPIKDQIECLQKVVLDYQKDINEPFFVRVIWGTIDFKGKLKKFNISYTQFQIDGSPIRAEVDMSILEYKASMHNKGKSGDGANKENKSNENTAEGKSEASGGRGGNQGGNNNGDNNGNNNGSNSSENSGNNSNEAGDNVNDGTNSSGENNGNNNSTNNNGGANAGGNNGPEKNLQNQANTTQPTDIGPVKQVQPGAGTTLPQLNGGVKNLDLLGKFNNLSAIRGMIGGLVAGLALGALGLAIPALLAGLLAWLLAKLVELIKRGVSFIKKKASKAKDKLKDGGKKIAGKTKEGAKKIAKKTKSGAKTVASKTKSAANKTAELFKKARK